MLRGREFQRPRNLFEVNVRYIFCSTVRADAFDASNRQNPTSGSLALVVVKRYRCHRQCILLGGADMASTLAAPAPDIHPAGCVSTSYGIPKDDDEVSAVKR